MRPRLLVLIFAAALTAAVSARQAPVPTFRGQVDAVEVDVFVTDRDGQPVPDLPLEDFEVLDSR